MKWAVYNLLFAVIYPFLLPGFLLRMLRRGGYAARFGDRFALYPAGLFPSVVPFGHDPFDVRPSADAPVWIHAVSVGEVQVAGQLMREWRAVEPSVRFCFSTTSSTGWKMAEKEVGPNDTLIYNPLDFPNFVKSALKTVRPRAVVLTESEIWPNFIRQAKKYGIPLFLINARVSDRSAPRYRLAKCFFGDVFRCFTKIFAQSDLDKARLVAAGAPEEAVEVTGSFKFDVAHRNPAKEAELRAWLAANGAPEDARILLGGSTWPGEDEVLLGIYRKLTSRETGQEGRETREGLEAGLSARRPLVLVLAPRHFEKADAVEANIRKFGFACVRRSRGKEMKDSELLPSSLFLHSSEQPPVFLADTTGELMGLYGLADVVFVGKSLCAHGSQNMIEPCLCGKPTFVGPYTENFRPVMSDLLAADAIRQVKDAAELGLELGEILGEGRGGKGKRKKEDGRSVEGSFCELGARAQAAVERRRGVVAKCVAAIRCFSLVFMSAFAVTGCSRKEPPPVRKTCAAVKAAVRGIYRLESAVTNGAARPTFKALDVTGLSAAQLKKEFAAFADPADAHLWMPGEKSWLVVQHAPGVRVSLARALDAVAGDDVCMVSLPEVFASYVGTLADILPAFANDLKGEIVPEWFVPEAVTAIGWIDPSDVDGDMVKSISDEIRSMRNVRREVLKGNMAARAATDKKGEEAACEIWARAALRNPNDPLLLERIDRLEANARAFLEAGQVLRAMKCFETIILIQPKHAVAIHNFGLCLQKLGKKDLAEKVLKRAEVLRQSREEVNP